MARLQYLLSTLHEGRCRSPCKTRFRLAASLYREGVEPSGALRKVSDSGYIVVLLSQALPVASWSHVRRKYVEAEKVAPVCAEVLRLVGQLYAIDADLPDLHALEGEQQAAALAHRLAVRQEKSAPLATAIGE
jgi:hypothetical protein